MNMGRRRTREEIVESMHPEVSDMEIAMQGRLYKEHRLFYYDHPFCLVSTKPDLFFPTKGIAVYLDGPVHKNRTDRDEELREKLAKRHNLKVISIEYKSFSKAEVDRVWKEIQEAIE